MSTTAIIVMILSLGIIIGGFTAAMIRLVKISKPTNEEQKEG